MPLPNKSLKRIAAGQKKKRRLLLVAMFCTTLSLLFSLFFGEMGLVHFKKMKEVKRQIQQEIETLEAENGRLLREIEALKTDPFYIERLARERLGFVKKGELVYEFYDQ